MNQTQSLRKMKNRIAVYLGIVTLILVPLCIKGSYFGLIELKARAFLYAAVPAVLLAAVLAAATPRFPRSFWQRFLRLQGSFLMATDAKTASGNPRYYY